MDRLAARDVDALLRGDEGAGRANGARLARPDTVRVDETLLWLGAGLETRIRQLAAAVYVGLIAVLHAVVVGRRRALLRPVGAEVVLAVGVRHARLAVVALRDSRAPTTAVD